LVDFALLKPITQYVTHPLSKAWSYAPLSSAQVQAEANRLLEQSTFGAKDVLLTHVQSIGTQAFLNEQFAAAEGQYPAIKYVPAGQQERSAPPTLTRSAGAIITRYSCFRTVSFRTRFPQMTSCGSASPSRYRRCW
jgi:hypothetical protein